MISAAVGVEPEKLSTVAPEALLAVQDVALPSMEADPTAWTTPEAITAFSPVIDGVTVLDNPWLAVRSGAARDIELICGYTRDEFTMFSMQRGMIKLRLSDLARTLPMAIGILRDRLRSRDRRPAPAATPAQERGQRRRARPESSLDAVARHLRLGASAPDAYRAAHPGLTDKQLYTVMYSDALFRMPSTWLAEAHAAAGGRNYLYEFAWTSPAWGSTLGAVHTLDIPVTFGHADGPLSAFLIGRSVPDDFTRLSRRLRDSWISFATTGDPGWPQFTTERPLVRMWDTEPSVAEDPLGPSRRIWRSRSGL